MFAIFIGLEECKTTVVLQENAADISDITGMCPAQVKDHLKWAAVTSGNKVGVMFMVKCDIAKI